MQQIHEKEERRRLLLMKKMSLKMKEILLAEVEIGQHILDLDIR